MIRRHLQKIIFIASVEQDASATGDALTFVSREEEKYLKSIEKFIGKNLKKKYEGFTNAPIQRIENI